MKTLLVLVGPTAVGKTALSVSLARRLSAPILSADSRQIYAELPIGTAAPTPDEMQDVPHYFVGSHHVPDYFSASAFETESLHILSEKVFPSADVAILSGGSMMYVDALCRGIDDIPSISPEVREAVLAFHARHGDDVLRAELHRLDPQFHAEVDLLNIKRVIHAVEVCREAGVPYSSLRTGRAKRRPFRVIKVGLIRPLPELYARIDARVDAMFRAGFLAEAERVYPFRAANALNTVGYKELFSYLSGDIPLDEARRLICRNTRHYARRQLSWWRRDADIRWFHPSNDRALWQYLGQFSHFNR